MNQKKYYVRYAIEKLAHMTGGQHQTISQDVASAESVLFIELIRAKQRLRTFQSVIAVEECLLFRGGG